MHENLVHRFHETNLLQGDSIRGLGSPGCGRFSYQRDWCMRMAATRKVVELPIGERELAELQSIARSRTESSSRVVRARIVLHYRDDPSCYAVGRAVGVTHQTVQRCLARASRFGVMAALDDSPRPGKEPAITVPARAWLVSLACQKAKEGWDTRTNSGRDAVASPS